MMIDRPAFSLDERASGRYKEEQSELKFRSKSQELDLRNQATKASRLPQGESRGLFHLPGRV
jgi:hypothetical protein